MSCARYWRSVPLLALLVSAPALAEETLPMRKAGLWELKTVMDEGQGARDQTLQICIDAEMERNTVQASLLEHKGACSKYEITRTADAVKVEQACQFASRHVVSTTEMSGDFTTKMHVKIDSTTSGKEQDRTIAVQRSITQDGTYLGESCGDLKPGEAKSPDGTKVMVQ